MTKHRLNNKELILCIIVPIAVTLEFTLIGLLLTNISKKWILSGVGASLLVSVLIVLVILRYRERSVQYPEPTNPGTTIELSPDSASEISSLPTADTVEPYPGIKVSLAKLPSTNPDLFGRERELAMLDAAWGNDRTNVVSLVAFGGVGKTALVSKWLLQMGADKYRRAERVYGYSFYSQGAAEGGQASADPFIAAALEWFGDPDPTAGSPWDKGERLAELIRKHRTLLILDGLEPLQYPPGEMEGRLKDPGLQSLLRELAHHNPGLCVVTTRLKVDDLKGFVGISVQRINLEDLSPEAGAELLKNLGVEGTDDELREAVGEFGGHALALTLLGSLLKEAYDGDIRHRREIGPLEEEMGGGGHARRVMESYERWLGEGAELSILRLMGLFDRPAEGGALAALREAPVIPELTDALFHQEGEFSLRDLFFSKKREPLSDKDWDRAVTKLRHARLLLDKDPNQPGTLDAHPLVREHFGEKLKKSNPPAWQEAHSRLYEYYKSHAKEYPDTIEEMAPLYAAVAHGCQADRYSEVWNKVYTRRIQGQGRPDGKRFYSTYFLGTFGNEVAAMSNFFLTLWDELVEGLEPSVSLPIMRTTGFCLRALGRLKDAVDVLTRVFVQHKEKQNWQEAAIDAGLLMNPYLLMGRIIDAKNCIEEGVDLADRGGDELEKIRKRIELAWVLLKMGDMISAEELFREAWEMEKADLMEQDEKYAYSVFRYCEFLLSKKHYEEALSCTRKAIKIEQNYPNTLAKALNALILGRVACMKGESDAIDLLNQAVEGFRKSHRRENLPRGLLARAELHRKTGNSRKACEDLDEVMTIATQSGMCLHKADCHLEYARLYLAMGEKDKARESLAIAKEMIGRMGYHRRDGDVRELEEEVAR